MFRFTVRKYPPPTCAHPIDKIFQLFNQSNFCIYFWSLSASQEVTISFSLVICFKEILEYIKSHRHDINICCLAAYPGQENSWVHLQYERPCSSFWQNSNLKIRSKVASLQGMTHKSFFRYKPYWLNFVQKNKVKPGLIFHLSIVTAQQQPQSQQQNNRNCSLVETK